ncbi:hypothetical protein LP415_19990 [Polaromonas sp. P1(28)-8]|nr:hypothetical protein LP415_19990 [Polaromonas sp. P1(28)-8]
MKNLRRTQKLAQVLRILDHWSMMTMVQPLQRRSVLSPQNKGVRTRIHVSDVIPGSSAFFVFRMLFLLFYFYFLETLT